MQVEELLETSATRWPEKTALVCGQKRLSYRELNEAANALAHSFLDNGLERGDRICIFADNSVETVIAIFATWKAGAVIMVVNPTTKADKLAYVLNNSRAAAIVTDLARLRTLHECWDGAPHVHTVWVSGKCAAASNGRCILSLDAILAEDKSRRDTPRKRCIDLDLAALIYTSGSTGRPKGVMAMHLNMVSAANSIATYLENSADDVILNVLPLAFGYGLYQAIVTFKTGGTLVLERGFTYPYAVVETMMREGVTGFALVPTIAAILLQMDLQKYGFPTLRYMTNAAAALPIQHVKDLRKALPHVKLFCMYGQTECTRISYLDPSQTDIRPGSVGRGMPNQEVYIVDEAGNRVASGVVGELVVRGAHVTRGYWEDPETTSRVFRPGPVPGERVLCTNDLFRMDDEGYLYFVSRKDDIIKTRAEKVSPKEVEDVIYALQGVSEAVVFGVPDALFGQAVKAVITLKPGASVTQGDVLRHCAARLEDFMVPKHVEFAETLPKTSSGKILRRELAMAAMGVQA